MNPRGILSLLSLGLLSSTALAQDPSCRTDPVKLQLSHYEEAPSAPVTGGGGLVGALNRVTSEIENAGTGGQVGATYSVDLTAVVERQPDGASRVSLLMGEPGVDVDETLPQDSKTAAQRELKLLEAKLRRYTADVPDGAERLLQLNEILSHLKLFDQPTLQTIELCDPAGAGEAPVLQLVQDPESGEWVVEEVPPGTAPTGALVERLFSEYGAEILRVTGPDGQMRCSGQTGR